MRIAIKVFFVLLFTFYGGRLFPHGDEEHLKDESENGESVSTGPEFTQAQKRINKTYLEKIKPIFKKSCFDCHSDQTKYPWYYKFPFVKDMIDDDIAEAKVHLDFSFDYPFVSHGTPRRDLEAIKKVVLDNSMPPMRYWIMHLGSRLTDKEKETVIEWVNNSLKELSD